MKKTKKLAILMLAVIMLFTFLAGCGGGEEKVGGDQGKEKEEGQTGKEQGEKGGETSEEPENFNATGFPIVDEKITLRMFGRKHVSHAADWNDMLVYQEMEKLSNIHIDWDLASDENIAERRNIILASGEDVPDAFHTALFSSNDIVKYANEGILMPVDDLIDKYAPNLKKLLEENPEAKKGLTLEDGKIYSFPLMVESDALGLRAGGKIWYNTEWMNKLNISEPTNTDEFYELLKAIKDGDPNGNGKADEIPLAPYSIDSLVSMFKGSWGLGNRGSQHGNVDVDESTGELRFIPIDPRYKELLEYAHKLYKEGLVDEEAFTPDWSKFVAAGQEGVYGVIYGIGPILINQVGNYDPASIIEGPHGDKMWHGVSSTLWGIGNFAISSTNEHPEATVRWIDYFYGDEGSLLFFMGKEGETFEITEDGEYEFLDVIKDNPDGLNLDQAVGQFTSQPGGGYPGLLSHRVFKGAEGKPESIEGSEKLQSYFPEEIWPPNIYNDEQVEFMSSTGSDINTYINESMEKFIRGDLSFSEWDNYVKQIEQMGLEQ